MKVVPDLGTPLPSKYGRESEGHSKEWINKKTSAILLNRFELNVKLHQIYNNGLLQEIFVSLAYRARNTFDRQPIYCLKFGSSASARVSWLNCPQKKFAVQRVTEYEV